MSNFLIPSYVFLILGCIGAFFGGYLAKSIELSSEYGDYYYYLRGTRRLRKYCAVYGLVSAVFLMLLSYSKVVQPDYLPDFETAIFLDTPMEAGIATFGAVMMTSLLIGFTSKGFLDMPISKYTKSAENHIKVSDLLAFIFPNVRQSFTNEIRSRELNYFNEIISAMEQQADVREIARLAYLYLRDNLDWKSEEKQRQLDIMMTEMSAMKSVNEALQYLYRNVGRDTFNHIMKSQSAPLE
ncbi:MAG: hypothetical protein RIB71_12695 [Imperialibacter sp.]|uniref:hypothetical protein n=1 Tax=Imperialibacter sp. TaxID=2038411 RepID=UPI0032EFC4E3